MAVRTSTTPTRPPDDTIRMARVLGVTAAGTDADAHPLPHGVLTGSPDLPEVDRRFYDLGPEVARGGMGRILAAYERRARRAVAVKELLASDPIAKLRFEREARITARLQHPSIVPIYEVGRWEDGEPFYAMKYVAGRSLHDEIQNTRTLQQRLALLPSVLAVADALAYAHSQCIVHRDLKPANVLMGAFGETVVIDWGLARELTTPDIDSDPGGRVVGEPGLTSSGDVIGTPAYMAPEQADGRPVDQRADVYALGATLYHLLVGQTPTTRPPTPLDRVEPRVPRDLLAIVKKALSWDPEGRYPSAKELADDLRRFTTGQLVGVHHYSVWQLLRRWMRRNRLSVAIAAAALVVLAVVVVLGATRLVRERRLVEQSRGDAEQLMEFMLGDLRQKLEPIGKLPLLEAVARKAVAYYDNRHDHRPDALGPNDRRLQARARLSLGDVLFANGDRQAALAAYRSARAIHEAFVAADPTNEPWQVDLAMSHRKIGDVLIDEGDQSAALAAFRAAHAIRELLVTSHPTNLQYQGDAAVEHSRIGEALLEAGNTSAALTAYRASQLTYEKLIAADPATARWQRNLGMARLRIGRVLHAQGDTTGAVSAFRAARASFEQLAATDPTDFKAQRDLSIAHEEIGHMLTRVNGDQAGGLAAYRAAQRVREKLVALDPTNSVWQRDLAVTHHYIGRVLTENGDTLGAIASHRAGLAITERLAVADPGSTKWQDDLAGAHSLIGNALNKRGDAAALSEFEASVAILERLTASAPGNTNWQRNLAICQGQRGELLSAQGDLTGARDAFRPSQSILEELASADPSNTDWQRDLAKSYEQNGNLLDKQHEATAAMTAYRRGLAILEKLIATDPSNTEWTGDVAKLRARLATCCKRSGPNKPHRASRSVDARRRRQVR